jgi:beta-glucosidase
VSFSSCHYVGVSLDGSGNRNLAPVFGGERDLRTMYLPPFERACLDSLAIMTAYSVYDGVPAIANKRERYSHML